MAIGTPNSADLGNLGSDRYRYAIAAMAIAGHLAIGLNMFTVSPLLPLAIDDYGINRTSAGLLVSLPMLMAAAFGLPGGMLLSRIGLRRAYFFGWASIALLALAPMTPGFEVLLVLRLVYGVGGFSLMVTATGPLLMQWFQPKQVMVITAINMAVLSLGIAASVAGAAPLAEATDWRLALTVFAGIGVPGFCAWIFVGRRVVGSSQHSKAVSPREVATVLRGRTIALLVAADVGVLSQYTAFTGWLPTFYNEERGITLSEAGFITGILPFVGVFAVLVGGLLPLRLGTPRQLFLGSGLMAGLGGLGTFLFPNLAGIYLAAVLLGVGSWLYVPTLLTLPMRMSGMTQERVAVVWGSFTTFSGAGAFVAPILVGGLRDVTGSFFPGFAICAVAGWSVFAAGLFLPRAPEAIPAAQAAQD